MFEVAGVRIAAVSRDSPYSHKKWGEQQWLDRKSTRLNSSH